MKPYNRLIHEATEGQEYTKIVAAYMRYSSDNQDEKSIENQRDAIVTYCQSQKYFLATEYWDEAYTGTNDKRPSFQKMMSDAHDNPPWDTILVFDYSRWFRNTAQSAFYECQLFGLGIDIFSITEQFDSSSEGKLMRDIKSAFNAFTSRNIGKFSLSGMVTNAKNGLHCGGIPPLGYDVKDKKLVVNEYEAEAVRRIFTLYENGYSYNQIADDLNSKGFRTKSGKPFVFNSFSSILHQEKYTGTFIWNRSSERSLNGTRNSHKEKDRNVQVRKPNAFPAIITREQFDRVQQLFTERQNGNAPSKNRYFYLLSGGGFLRCAECGALMIGEMKKSHGRSYRYYYCPTHKKNKSACSHVGINAADLEPFVISILMKDIKSRQDLITLYNTNDVQDWIRILKNQILGLEKSIANLTNALTYDVDKDSKEAILSKLQDCASRKDELNLEIEQITARLRLMTEADRSTLCKQLSRLIRKGSCIEVKKYVKETIAEIKVSKTDVEVTLNVA